MTTKPHFAVHDTFEWLAQHRVPTTEVHIVDDKTTVDCDVYLDDADHNLSALRERPSRCHDLPLRAPMERGPSTVSST